MSYRSPLGNNYGWVVSKDHHFAPRDVTQEIHDTLAITAVVQDPELAQIEAVLGYKVILAVKVGKYTIHVRVYKLSDVERKPDNLPSRMGYRDDSAFMTFNGHGGVTLVEGRLREMAQGHTPVIYADRRFSPNKVQAMDGMQAQFTGSLPAKIGLPRASKPLQPEEEWVEIGAKEPPTLESA